MTEGAEQADQGPLISDDEREQASARVREALTEGRIAMAELDPRLTGVYQARTRGELEKATQGLPVPGPRDALVVDRPPTSRFALGLFGAFVRRGEWVVPPAFTSCTVFGGGILDLSEARFTSRETHVTAVSVWGGTKIVVPDDVEVEVRGIGVFGLFGRRGARAARPGAPRVVIKGLALWGAVFTKNRDL